MTDSITSGHVNGLFLTGLMVCLGAAAAKFFQVLRIPQIIGCMAMGIVLGPVLNLVGPDAVESLEPLNYLTLAVVGFLIGAELKRDVFQKFGRQVATILMFEGLSAFFLVGSLSFVALLFYYQWQTALAGAVVLGAICSATDPASTVNVLWEYKTRGPMTSMLTAVVALDDVLAIVLYIASIAVAGALTGGRDNGSAGMLLLQAVYEIGGSLAFGAALAAGMHWLLQLVKDNERAMVFSIGGLVLSAGAARALHLDIILSTMSMGAVLVNMAPRRSSRSFEAIRGISTPLYILFFVIIGARLKPLAVGWQVFWLVAIYVLGSIAGKTVGAWWGAARSGAVSTVRKYMGFCLYPQGTVAVALLMMASTRFHGPAKDHLISVIVIGVLILQFIGPVCVQLAARKAGEVGLNITEDDLVKIYKVADVMDTRVPVIGAGLSLSEVIRVVSGTDGLYYPVVDGEGKLIGAVTLDGIRKTFTTQELNDWLVALDIMEPVSMKFTPQESLSKALELAGRFDIERSPVVDPRSKNTLVGLLDVHSVRRTLAAEVLARQQKADLAHRTQV